MEELKVLEEVQVEERRSFWEKKFLEYDTHYRGMNYKDFCEAQSLNYGQLKYWRQRLHHQKRNLQGKDDISLQEKKVSFIPVEIASREMSEQAGMMEFYYGKAYRFVLPLSIEEVILVKLFKALEESHAHAAVGN